MDCNIDKIKKFNEKVTSSPFIKFEQSQGKPIGYSKEMRPSALITSSYGTGSIGYVAKKIQKQSVLLQLGMSYQLKASCCNLTENI